MNQHYENVRRFMELGGQRHLNSPFGGTTKPLRLLGSKLMLEECQEACRELGVDVSMVIQSVNTVDMVNLGRLAKELCDLHVVTTWNMLAYGIPPDCQRQVDQNNLDKFGLGWTKREDGKVLPPPGFKKLGECKVEAENWEKWEGQLGIGKAVDDNDIIHVGYSDGHYFHYVDMGMDIRITPKEFCRIYA